MPKKLITTWEKEKGIIFTSPDIDIKSKVDENEINGLINNNMTFVLGINWADRVNFLKSNGYEVTRDNLIDVNLPSKLSEN